MNWRRIIIHHTASPATWWADDIRHVHMQERGWSDGGYHFTVRHAINSHWTVVEMLRPLYRPGAHTRGLNSEAIGVALIGNFEYEPPPADMVYRAAELCAGLCRAFDIPTLAITGHKAHAATVCPGLVSVDEIRSLVGSLRSGRWARSEDLLHWARAREGAEAPEEGRTA